MTYSTLAPASPRASGSGPSPFWFRVAGINHLSWITKWRTDGQDGHAFLKDGWRSTAPDGSPGTT